MGLPPRFSQLKRYREEFVKAMKSVAVALRSGKYRNRGVATAVVVAIILLFTMPSLAELNDVELGRFFDILQKMF